MRNKLQLNLFEPTMEVVGNGVVWKQALHEGYSASTDGEVCSFRQNTKRALRQITTIHGYKRVTLAIGAGQYKPYMVHRLIATVFIPNPNNYPIVHHKNHIKTDNRVENLEWTTCKGNTMYAVKAGLLSRETKHVFVYNKKNGVCREYKSAAFAAKELGISSGHVSHVLSGKLKQSNGYGFAYSFTALLDKYAPHMYGCKSLTTFGSDEQAVRNERFMNMKQDHPYFSDEELAELNKLKDKLRVA